MHHKSLVAAQLKSPKGGQFWVWWFSDRGVVYTLPTYRVPQSSRTAKGTPVVQLLPIPREEAITSLLSVSSFDDESHLLMLTKGGFIKRTSVSAFGKIRSNGLIAIGLEEGDALSWVRLAVSGDGVLIASKTGMTIHFRINEAAHWCEKGSHHSTKKS